MIHDKVIYQQFKGKMVKIAEPRLPNNNNFVITWQGMDWSGFRTLARCVEQFSELESSQSSIDGRDLFQVVER